MVDPDPNHADQLSTNVNRLQTWPLIIALVPLLRAAFHLRRIVGRQGQMLEVTTSSYRPSRDKVVQGERIEGLESTPWTLDSLINGFSRRIDHVRIIACGPGVLDIESRLELLKPFGASIVDILGVGDELRRRRSVGGRHFKWRMGGWCKTQWLTLLLAAHVRHGLIWSSLPLPQDSSVCQPDKPQIFFSHSDPKPFGVWCYFYFHLTHLCSILVTPLSFDPFLSPITPLWFLVNPPILHDSESSYSFYSYLPLRLLLGHSPCTRPALIMYVYKRLVSAVGIPQTWNQLGSLYRLSSLQQP